MTISIYATSFESELARPRGLSTTELAAFPRRSTLADPDGNEFDLIRG